MGRYKVAMKSIIGTRAEQQDRAFQVSNNQGAFAIVCDGMGGSECGSAASLAVVEKFKELYGKKDPLEAFPEFYLKSIDILDECVYHLRNKNGKRAYAGTTIVAAVIEHDELFWLSVGDSRMYILRGDEFVQATRDHNYFFRLNKMLGEKEIDESQYQIESVKGDALISFVGMGGIEVMDISKEPFKLIPGDTILLTTDGLYKALKDEDIKKCLQTTNVETATDVLVRKASEIAYRAQDNTTCIVIRYDGDEDII